MSKCAFLCSHVFERVCPVFLVSHADGDWQFLCGGGHEEDETPRVVGIDHVVDDDQNSPRFSTCLMTGRRSAHR